MKSFITRLFILILCGLLSLNFAFAKTAKKKSVKNLIANIPIQTTLIVDANSGKILHSENSSKQIYPASLTKLMTLYMAFDAVKRGDLSLHQPLSVSAQAEKMRPCKLWLKQGETISTADAIKGLIVKSANDVAVVLAEAIGGSEAIFAKKMNEKAKKLGMKNSNFTNASGWHHPNQKTTAADLAKLTLAIKRDFPEFYPWFKSNSFTFRGQTIAGHNRVTQNYTYAEGMKTGFTVPAGFNLVTTAKKDGKSLVAVVTGSPSATKRDKKMITLLDSYLGVDKTRTNNIFEIAERASKKKDIKTTNIASLKNKSSKKQQLVDARKKVKKLPPAKIKATNKRAKLA